MTVTPNQIIIVMNPLVELDPGFLTSKVGVLAITPQKHGATYGNLCSFYRKVTFSATSLTD